MAGSILNVSLYCRAWRPLKAGSRLLLLHSQRHLWCANLAWHELLLLCPSARWILRPMARRVKRFSTWASLTFCRTRHGQVYSTVPRFGRTKPLGWCSHIVCLFSSVMYAPIFQNISPACFSSLDTITLEEYSNTKAMESTLKSLKYSLKKNFRCGS